MHKTAQDLHIDIMKSNTAHSSYEITADWHAVLIADEERGATLWLEKRLGQRAVKKIAGKYYNDFSVGWCHPTRRVFIIRDDTVAVEFKLIFG